MTYLISDTLLLTFQLVPQRRFPVPRPAPPNDLQMPVKLSAIGVTNAKPKSQRYEIADSEQPGLRLVVQPSGAKSWAFRYERADSAAEKGARGKSVKVTLGRAAGPGALSLQQARNAANDARRLRSTGKDPADQRRAERAAEAARIEAEEKEARRRDDTVALVLERYYHNHVNGLKSAREVKRILSRELAGWHRRRIDDITRADAFKLLETIERRAPIIANRTRAHARTFFKWCIARGLIEVNPFEHTTAATKEVARDRVLSDVELRLLLVAKDQMEWPWQQFLEVLLLTGQRREEVAGMLWSELDLDGTEPLWMLGRDRAKNGQAHAVPLAPAVVELLHGIDRVQITETIDGATTTKESPFVFTTTGRTSVSGFSKAKATLIDAMHEIACKEATERGDDASAIKPAEFRLHDLRRTFATTAARLRVDVGVIERVLNHKMQGVMAVYQRYQFLPEKRHALNVWADHLASLTTARGVNVVQFKAGARE